MKKMWIIAAVACAALMVSCGGEEKKTDVVAKAKEYVAKAEAAMKEGDYEKVQKLNKESEDWYNSLSKADQKKVDKALGLEE